jgi:hypothetical protein
MKSLVALAALAVGETPSLHERVGELNPALKLVLLEQLCKHDLLVAALMPSVGREMSRLVLANTALGDGVVEALAAAPGLAVRELNLSQTSSARPQAYRRLAQRLVECLSHLDVSQQGGEGLLGCFASRCVLLRCVRADDSAICNRDVQQLLQRCPLMQELSLRRCSELTDRAFTRGLPARCYLLRLDLREVRKLTDLTLERIADCCPVLMALSLEGQRFDGGGLTRLLNQCCELESLAIPLCQIQEAALVFIRNTSVRVKQLDLFGSTFAEATLLFLFGNVFRNLRKLNISGVRHLTRQVFRYVCLRSPHLEQLSVKGHIARFNDEFLEDVQANLKSLHSLDLSLCRAVSTEGLLRTFAAVPSTFRCINLISMPASVTDEVVKAIVERSGARLTKLSLGGNPQVTNASMAAIATHCSTLESLCVKGCQVSDPSLLCSLVAANPRLRMLSLSGVAGCKDEVVQAVAKSCPDIQELYLSGVAVTNEAVAAFKHVYPKCYVYGKRKKHE